jgi:DNA repair ATPase RecN
VEEGAAKPKKKSPTPRTLVFDEIDIGIGGRAAEAVGQKLKSLSRGQQVLCVTHLPQIAAFADQHFLIDKREDPTGAPRPKSACSTTAPAPRKSPACYRAQSN